MIYVEKGNGYYVEVPEDVVRQGDAAIATFVAAAPAIDALDPGAPSAIVEAERAKLFQSAEVSAEAELDSASNDHEG